MPPEAGICRPTARGSPRALALRARPPEAPAFAGVTRRGALALIRLWQLTFSAVLPPSCRFSPSCSAYMHQAIIAHGLARGVWLGIRRIARCHPWGGSGHDPVP